jgi:hypothetical protein
LCHEVLGDTVCWLGLGVLGVVETFTVASWSKTGQVREQAGTPASDMPRKRVYLPFKRKTDVDPMQQTGSRCRRADVFRI